MILAMDGPAFACPFCEVVAEPLAWRRDRGGGVAVGEAIGEAIGDTRGRMRQAFRLHGSYVTDADGQLHPREEATRVVEARVTAAVRGTAVLFRQPGADSIPSGWAAIAADELLLSYCLTAPATSLPAPQRLAWFATRLEHPNRVIAEDAFAEFGIARFPDVQEAGPALNPVLLRAWLTEPGIDQRRRGFYGLALGITAAATGNPTDRAASLKVLQEAAAAAADDFRSGFDGILGGLLVAEGAGALARFEQLGLFPPTGRPVDQRHLLRALRFAWEHLSMTVPQNQVADATARLLDNEAVAAEATIDLARYQWWAASSRVAGLWKTVGRDDPLVRRAVVGYLQACPRPEARQLLAALRETDPDRFNAAAAAAALPLGR
jgi:hypothetical protein